MKRSPAYLTMLAGLALALPAQAVCPVCTVAVIGGIGLSRWLGVDDLITGVWIGGLIISLTVWTLDWLGKKKLRFRGDRISMAALYYLIVLAPLWFEGVIGHPLNSLWGVDRLVLGTAAGSLVFLLAARAHDRLKMKNGGRSYFPFQKVALPVLSLAAMSGLAYLIK